MNEKMEAQQDIAFYPSHTVLRGLGWMGTRLSLLWAWTAPHYLLPGANVSQRREEAQRRIATSAESTK